MHKRLRLALPRSMMFASHDEREAHGHISPRPYSTSAISVEKTIDGGPVAAV